MSSKKALGKAISRIREYKHKGIVNWKSLYPSFALDLKFGKVKFSVSVYVAENFGLHSSEISVYTRMYVNWNAIYKLHVNWNLSGNVNWHLSDNVD